jgi:hypothetical protein
MRPNPHLTSVREARNGRSVQTRRVVLWLRGRLGATTLSARSARRASVISVGTSLMRILITGSTFVLVMASRVIRMPALMRSMNSISDEDEDEEDWVDESHHISHDLDSDVVQSDTLFFGRLLTEPGPNPSSLNQLDYDSEIATLLQYDFHAETEFVFGSLEDAPRNVRIFFELLQAFEENLNWACLQLTGGRPTTTVDAVDEAVLFSNFRIRHDRLRRNMLATREEALSWFEHYSVVITNIPARAFIDVFERYCILHAPRYIWNAQAHHRAPGRHQKIRYDVGSIFESKRRERRDDGSEDELLLHKRRVDSEDTYVYA